MTKITYTTRRTTVTRAKAEPDKAVARVTPFPKAKRASEPKPEKLPARWEIIGTEPVVLCDGLLPLHLAQQVQALVDHYNASIVPPA